MREGRSLVGLQVSHTAVMGENGVVRQEVMNTIARQVKMLRDERCDVFLFVSRVAEYCCSETWTGDLRTIFGKICVLRQYANALARRHMQICPLDSNIKTIRKVLEEAFYHEMVPVISSDIHNLHANRSNYSCFISDDIYFASLCSMLKADVAVIVADKAEVNMKADELENVFPSDMTVKMTVYYQPDFLLDAVNPVSDPKHRVV